MQFTSANYHGLAGTYVYEICVVTHYEINNKIFQIKINRITGTFIR